MAPNDTPNATDSSREDWTDFAHTGPGTLAGRYMRTFWQPVYLSRDLEPGRAKPIKVMSENFTLYRGMNGEPHLLAFRCAHRGTQLSTGWVEGDNLRCFYHGWVYGPDGKCVEQPAEPEPFCQRIHIKSYPVREYLGAVFAYLGEGEPPPMYRFPEFEAPGRFRIARQVWACNYFQRLENSLDHVHGAFTHRQRTNDYGLGEVPQVYGYETPYGIKVIGLRPGHIRMMHFHMPNFNYRPPWAAPKSENLPETAPDPEGGAAADLVWRVPVDDYSVASYLLDHLDAAALARDTLTKENTQRVPDYRGYANINDAAEAVLRGEDFVEHLRGMSGMTNVEDYVSQVGQGRIVDRSADHLGRSDILVRLFRQLWTRDLRALAEGRPLTAWHRLAPEQYERSAVLAPGEKPDPQLMVPAITAGTSRA